MTTLFYGTLAEVLLLAEQQEEAMRDGLFLQTRSDVIAYRDFVGG